MRMLITSEHIDESKPFYDVWLPVAWLGVERGPVMARMATASRREIGQ